MVTSKVSFGYRAQRHSQVTVSPSPSPFHSAPSISPFASALSTPRETANEYRS